MKKQNFKTITIKTFVAAFASTILLAVTAPNLQASEITSGKNEAKISYVGTENNLMSFNIKFRNESEAPFLLELSDDMGHLLYKESFKGKDFEKNILFKSLTDDAEINFVIRSGKKTTTQKFKINTKVTEIAELDVTRL